MIDKATKAVDILKILSSRTRFQIISLLMKSQGDLCVNEIAEAIGMTHSATSHQLSKLEDKGVVRSFRTGVMVCYKLETSPDTRELLAIVNQFA